MNLLSVALEQSLPKRPINAGLPKQILRTVVFVNTGNRMSLKKFCERLEISYQGCIEQIGRKPDVPFMQIVSEMRARAKRKRERTRIHDCPHCRCARAAENQDARAAQPDLAGSPAAGDDVQQMPSQHSGD